MNFQDIISAIDRKEYSPIYLLHGEESFFIDKISKKLEEEVLNDGEKAFNQVVLYGKDIEFKDVVDNARQFPMMSAYRVVIINEAQQMRSLKKLESYAENPAPQTVLVINHKHKKIDARLKLVKTIKKTGIVFESKKLYDNQIAPWITGYLKERKISIEATASHMIAELIGADLSKISNELDKMIINAGVDGKITADEVSEQVGISKDFNVFELQKAISLRDTEKAFRIVDYFAANEKSNPLPLIIGNLYSYLVKVYIASFHKKKTDFELQKLIGLPSPYFVKEYRAATKNYSSSKVLSAFSWLKEADLTSKGVGHRNYNTSGILRDFLIKLFY